MTLLSMPAPVQQPAAPRDLVLTRQLHKLLANSGYRGLARIECRIQAGVVELTGQVPSYYLKQLAQSLVMQATTFGVRNHIQVRSVAG